MEVVGADLRMTDLERIEFLLETDAAPAIADCGLRIADLLADGGAGEGTELLAEADGEGRPKYITNYIGSKQKLVDWIWKHTPDDVESVLDAFTGSAVVAYMYKSKGLRVLANDRLKYSYHAARAIIENSDTRITDDDLERLLAQNPKAGTFVRDTFKGIFFAQGVHGIIDNLRANCNGLKGFKKDIALFALGKTCMSGKGGFGHFSSSTDYGKRQDTPEEFIERFKGNIARINALVLDNGEACKAYNEDINAILPKVEADLAYFDPPYATEFSTTNYEKSYHFVEGLMTYWDGLTINTDSKVRFYETDHETVTKVNAKGVFETFLGNAKHIPHWLISYRDHAYPNESEMKAIISGHGRESNMKSQQHHYSITSKHGENSNALERLFICRKGKAAAAKEAQREVCQPATPELRAAAMHTSAPAEVIFPLSSEALDVATGPAGDPQFTFVLCRAGTNRNGDHFLGEELATRYMTAVNKKIDLKHSQDFTDIVGGIAGADYVEDAQSQRVECAGELYNRDSANAQLAYKLMKRGIITHVSMECDYEHGECSVCGKKVTNKNEYCAHLRKYKGAEFQGKPVYEILHGVTFTGVGLLDRKGADENARIIQVASEQKTDEEPKGGPSMEDDLKQAAAKDDPAEGAKKAPAPDGGGGGGTPPASDDPKARVKELEKENKELKQQVTDLQKQIQALEAEKQAAANRARAQKLVRKLEKQGLSFGSDDEREQELFRLASMSDEAFSATETAYERMASAKAAEPEKKEPAQAAAQPAKQDPPMKSDAGIRPLDVDDKKSTLESQLKDGFMQAYHDRVGHTGDAA